MDAGGKGFLVILQGMLDELRASPASRPRTRAPSKRRPISPRSAKREITFAFDTVFIVRKTNRHVDLTPIRPTLTASVTVWSSVRTMMPSRSTSIPTPPATP